MPSTTFIYGLTDPRDGEIHYVGKGDILERRRKQHIQEAKREGDTSSRRKWILELLDLGLELEIQALAEVLYEEYGKNENAVMDGLRADGAILYNIAPGGGGMPKSTWAHNPERRALASERAKKQWKNPEYRANTIAGLKKTCNTPEYKQKMSEMQREIWANNKEGKAKISKANLENWTDPDYRRRVTESNIEAWSDQDLLAAHSERTAALWETPEYREMVLDAIRNPDVQARRVEKLKAIWSDPEKRRVHSERMKEMWADPEHHERHAAANRAAGPQISQSLKDYYAEHPEAREHLSRVQTERMADLGRREHLSKTSKALWQDPEFVAKQEAAAEEKGKKVSAALKKHFESDEAHQVHSDAATKRWAKPEYQAKQAESRRKRHEREKAEWQPSDVERAAKTLGIAKRTAYQYCQKGLLGRKIGRSWVVTDEDVETFKANRKRGSQK